MKNSIINFKDEAKIKKQFEELCSELCTTPSHELRLFVRRFIKQKSNKPIQSIKSIRNNESKIN